MNQFINILVFFILFFITTIANGATLKWDIPAGDRLEIVRTANVKYLVNSKTRRIYKERNIVDLTCYKKKGDSNLVNGAFSVFHKEYSENVFRLREQYIADFLIHPNGKFRVGKKDYMPNLRHIPSFSKKDVKPNDSWSAKGELVLNNFSRQFKLTFPVKYKLIKIKKVNGIDTATIKYQFMINADLRRGNWPRDFPLKILGENNGIIHWDIKNNKPLKMDEQYRIRFAFRRYRGFIVTEYRMNIDSIFKTYSQVTKKDKEKAKKELKKELPDIDVDIEERGLVLRLGEVLFDFDSHKLRNDAKKTLDKIIKALKKKYPDRELIIEGHTDNIGKRKYNMKLSERRSKSVAEYLKSRGGHDKLSYRGFGPDNPIANNRTKKGRQKNRRVDIIIKLK
ncbi:OmpA family protein [Spirochaetota bacterium]